MAMLKRPAFTWTLAIFVVIAIAAAGVLTAESPRGLRASAGAPVAKAMTGELPPVAKRPMNVNPVPDKLESILSFDDGTCESGLGAGTSTPVTDLVDFDVPTQCTMGGLDIVGVTARMNTGMSISSFAFAQMGTAPPAAGTVPTLPIAPIPAVGPCPATALTSRAVGPGAAIITDTANFFAGVRASGFVGRDTSTPAGRMWLLCASCSDTQYSPTDLSSFGLGGNWMIRVTVEDNGCIPVELMEFSVSDG